MNHDRLVLALLAHDIRTGLRALSLSDVLWLLLGGGLLGAYAVADVWVGLGAHAAAVRGDAGLWLVRAPIIIAIVAAVLGNLAARAAARRAQAPFLKALPIALEARRHMAIMGSLALGLPVVAATFAAVVAAALIVGKQAALGWGLGEAAVAAAAFAGVALARLRLALGSDEIAVVAAATAGGPLLFGLGIFDRGSLPWLGVWAWNLPAGRIRLTVRLAGLTLLVTFGAVLAIGASFGRHEAGPAAVASVLCGFAVFMLTVRYAPLQSPVLRTAPVGFGRVWRRLLRLPMIFSAVSFALPASAATIAEPSAVTGRFQDGIGLAVLDWSYAVFAAYFANSPLAGAVSFLAAVVYTIYEASEFSGAMVIGFAALLAFLWGRTRRRYLGG